MNILMVVTPDFNLAATVNFLDPFRAANYLDGSKWFDWTLASVAGGQCVSSNGMVCATVPLANVLHTQWELVVVSSSWAPESHSPKELTTALRRWARAGSTLGALDTGAFVLAEAGLLQHRRVTVHYEHLDSFHELYPDVSVIGDLFVFDGNRVSCCGGSASIDFSLHVIESVLGPSIANTAARYLCHHSRRAIGTPQAPDTVEPLGGAVPSTVRKAINVMEEHIEDVLSIPDICRIIKISQRQLDRLFATYVKKSPALCYRDIRLDRSRGLVTQTDLPLAGVSVATGFSSQIHFSRVYKERFGLPPKQDRIEGRIPFEYRAKPLHKKRRAN